MNDDGIVDIDTSQDLGVLTVVFSDRELYQTRDIADHLEDVLLIIHTK